MSSPLEVVEKFMAHMEKLEYDAGMKYVTDDVEYINMPASSVVGKGPAAIRAVLEPFFGPTLENQWVIRNKTASGNIVYLERLDKHKFPGGWCELPVFGVFEVEDGKIKKWREYFDMATIQKGMAEVMTPAANQSSI